MYNILYGDKFAVTDFDDFTYTDADPKKLNIENNQRFNYELYYFLVDGHFNKFVSDSYYLNNLYNEKGINIINFIESFRKILGEYNDCEIKTLKDGIKCLDKKRDKSKYFRR